MHQEEIYIITYKRILQKLRGINKNQLFYGKFQKGIYTNIFIVLLEQFLIVFIFLDLKLSIMQNLYIEIFIVETYYLIYQI